VSGSTVYLANGLYKESNSVVDQTMTVQGESRDGVVIAPGAEDTGDYCHHVWAVATSRGLWSIADNVTIKDLTVDGTANNLSRAARCPTTTTFRVGILKLCRR